MSQPHSDNASAEDQGDTAQSPSPAGFGLDLGKHGILTVDSFKAINPLIFGAEALRLQQTDARVRAQSKLPHRYIICDNNTIYAIHEAVICRLGDIQVAFDSSMQRGSKHIRCQHDAVSMGMFLCGVYGCTKLTRSDPWLVTDADRVGLAQLAEAFGIQFNVHEEVQLCLEKLWTSAMIEANNAIVFDILSMD